MVFVPACCFQRGDHVRLHYMDADESTVFTEEGQYLTGIVVARDGAHDSCVVEVGSSTTRGTV